MYFNAFITASSVKTRARKLIKNEGVRICMALKCAVCGEKIEANFLEKIFGTYVGRGKKKKAVCNNCQRKYGEKVKEMVK